MESSEYGDMAAAELMGAYSAKRVCQGSAMRRSRYIMTTEQFCAEQLSKSLTTGPGAKAGSPQVALPLPMSDGRGGGGGGGGGGSDGYLDSALGRAMREAFHWRVAGRLGSHFASLAQFGRVARLRLPRTGSGGRLCLNSSYRCGLDERLDSLVQLGAVTMAA